MYYEVFEGFEEMVLVERVDYEYDAGEQAGANGNPTFVVRKPVGSRLLGGIFAAQKGLSSRLPCPAACLPPQPDSRITRNG